MPCEQKHTKKYTSRASPPYPANECRGHQRMGNDGKQWVSTRASNGVYRWKARGLNGGSPKNSPSRWIARATLKSTKGRFAAKAAHAGMTTAMFACHVLKNKLDYSLKTCREAQMFVNMDRSRRC